jgi:crotonobetainyl-CoA:carnitine CoA-transferase CaiB-like acyl-CoA transferase
MFPMIDHPTIGPHRVTGIPVKFSETPGGRSMPAPLLGQHTRFALAELLGLDESTIDDLSGRGVIFDSPTGST